MNTNFKVIGLTRHGSKPKSTAAEADALTTGPSELKKMMRIVQQLIELKFRNFRLNETISRSPRI